MKQCEKWPLAEVNIDDCLIKGLYKLLLNSSKTWIIRLPDYKTFFMLKSTEHEISIANKN